MADMHVLTGNADGSYRVVMHFPVPAGLNPVGTAWSAALVEDAGFNEDGTPAIPTTELRSISVAEKAEIEAGTVFEYVTNVHVEGSGQTNAGRRAVLRASYAAAKASLTTSLQDRLKFYGHEESEA